MTAASEPVAGRPGRACRRPTRSTARPDQAPVVHLAPDDDVVAAAGGPLQEFAERLITALTTARWADGSLIVDVDPTVLLERAIDPWLRTELTTPDLPCRLGPVMPERWEQVDGCPELARRRCLTCGATPLVVLKPAPPVGRTTCPAATPLLDCRFTSADSSSNPVGP